MKRRIVKKMEHNVLLPRRNFNKYAYAVFSLQNYWSFCFRRKRYVRTNDGRIFIYSELLNNGRVLKGKGYYLWNDKHVPPYEEYFS